MLRKNRHLLLVILFSIIFLSATVLNGLKYNFGYGFWNAHGHDAIWHLAVSNQTLKSIPPPNPIFSGHKLTGYHWGYDFLLQLLHFITKIPTINLYFQVIPILITICLVYLSFKLKKNNQPSGLIFLFLNFFAGSLGYLVTLIKSGQIGGESIFWSMQSISTLINPPYALSLVIFMTALVLYQKNLKKNSAKIFILIGFLFGLNTIVKIYASIISGLTILILFLTSLVKKDKQNTKNLFLILLSSGITSLFFLSIIGFSSSSNLIFKPFWFVNSLIDAYDKLYIPQISVLRFNLENQFSLFKFPILLLIYLFSFFAFLIGNMGTRALGLSNIFKKLKLKRLKHLDLFLLTAMTISLIIPMLFIQSGTPWNTIQFFYYFLFISNFYFADYLLATFNKNKLIFYLIILLTIPTTLSTIKSFIGFPPPANLPISEINALNFLKKQPSGIVLSPSFDQHQPKPDTPIPLYLYQTSAYVSAFSEKISFLEDYMNLDITGYDWQSRKKQVDDFFSSQDSYQATGFLLNNQIDYIYLPNNSSLPDSLPTHQLDQIYQQSDIKIYKVLK